MVPVKLPGPMLLLRCSDATTSSSISSTGAEAATGDQHYIMVQAESTSSNSSTTAEQGKDSSTSGGGALTWVMPGGNLDHAMMVAFGTFLAAAASTAVLVRSAIDYSKHYEWC